MSKRKRRPRNVTESPTGDYYFSDKGYFVSGMIYKLVGAQRGFVESTSRQIRIDENFRTNHFAEDTYRLRDSPFKVRVKR